VDGQEVSALETRFEVDEFGTEAAGALLGDVGIERDEVHPERVELFGDLLADAAEADDAEGLAVEFGTEVVAFGPFAVFQADVCLWDRAGGRERHRDGVLGGCAHVALGSVSDDDTFVRGGVDVDVVDTDARSTDDNQFLGGREDLVGDFGPGANDEPVGVRDCLEEVVSLEFVARFDLVAGVSEYVQTRIRDRIRDENLHVRANRAEHVNPSVVAPGGKICLHSLECCEVPPTIIGTTHVRSGMYERILLPTDAAEGTELAIDHAVAVADHAGAELHLLYVVDSDVYSSYSGDEYVHEFEGLEAALEQVGEAALESAAEAAAEADVETTTVVRHGDPHKQILEYADEADVDLLVMGSKERSGEYRQLLGSVTDRVARLASRPVTIVKTPVDGEE